MPARLDLDEAAIFSAFSSGESILQISKRLGVCRNVLTRRLCAGGLYTKQPPNSKVAAGSELGLFMQNFEFDLIGGCWLWAGHINLQGYGAVSVGERSRELIHRTSWRLHRGPIPGGLFVCHRCDVRPCGNPDHLFLGTYYDNMDDMIAKGRIPHGERHPHAKLTEAGVRQIRASRPEDHQGLADLFGVNIRTVVDAFRRRTWRRLA